MTAQIPTTEPAQVTAGDKIQWTRQDLTDYLPADGWELSYVLINSAGKIEIAATTSGTGYAVTVDAADSAEWEAGLYSYQAYVTDGADRVTVGSGTIEVLPNFATADVYDTRSHVKKTLDAIEATIEGRASIDQESYSIMGRQLKRTPMADLLKLRDRYKALYIAEQNAEAANNGKSTKNKVKVRL